MASTGDNKSMGSNAVIVYYLAAGALPGIFWYAVTFAAFRGSVKTRLPWWLHVLGCLVSTCATGAATAWFDAHKLGPNGTTGDLIIVFAVPIAVSFIAVGSLHAALSQAKRSGLRAQSDRRNTYIS